MIAILYQDVPGDGTLQQDRPGLGAPGVDEGMWLVQRLKADAWLGEIRAILAEKVPGGDYSGGT